MARVTFNAKLAFVNKSILPPEQNIAEGIVASASSYNNSIIILNKCTTHEKTCVATPHTDQRVWLVHTDQVHLSCTTVQVSCAFATKREYRANFHCQ